MRNDSVLSEFIKGVALKYASKVETDPKTSNQHELNGVTPLKAMLGTAKRMFPRVRFISFDENDSVTAAEGSATWYDARGNHPARTEYRLYYSENEAMSSVRAGDLIVVALLENDDLMIASAPSGSVAESELALLFAPADSAIEERFTVRTAESMSNVHLSFVTRSILDLLEIDAFEKFEGFYLEDMINRFGGVFPGTRAFSEYAANTLAEIPEDPDEALPLLMEREEVLFRLYEKTEAERRLANGFDSVEEFVEYAKSLMNRRYSRAGHAFENHLARLFSREGLHFSRGPTTELHKRPDFVFPSIEAYRTLPDGDVGKFVTVLGAKTSCKDRWRQILNEAERVETKHLATIQPALSNNQLDEMRDAGVVLVVPEEVRLTYQAERRNPVLNLAEFIDALKNRQRALDGKVIR
ncbi:MAG: Type-2 restriction enzyme EcoRII [Synergistetes bacterium ADurb.BinA166]|jgi:hypothetical protein|nr:MAG: Type-2 restriction enzyme EcoRII [Synergistetes bacterium ADurb.BinA166]